MQQTPSTLDAERGRSERRDRSTHYSLLNGSQGRSLVNVLPNLNIHPPADICTAILPMKLRTTVCSRHRVKMR